MSDSTLANPQRVIAELRRELAETQRRLDEARADRDEGEAQKAAIAEVLQVINSSPDDLAQVFDAMLHSAMRLCDASYGHFRILDGESLVPVAIRGASELFEQLEPRSANAASPSGRILAGERIVHILDLKEVYLRGPGRSKGRARDRRCWRAWRVALTAAQTAFSAAGRLGAER